MVRLIALRSRMRSLPRDHHYPHPASATQWLQGEGLESAIACPAKRSTRTLHVLCVHLLPSCPSDCLQGEGLESAIACPAWAPVLSLESIDGQLWREMRDDFDALMRQLPPAPRLQVGGS